MTSTQHYLKRFFEDKDGKLTIIQFPNPLLLAWLVILATTLMPIDSEFKTQLQTVNTAILFAWSYLEVSQGSSNFRRALGTVIMILIILGLFSIRLW
jgi:hypothetical protein